MTVKFVPHEMQGAFELNDEIKQKVLDLADDHHELVAYVYDLMVEGAEIGMAAAFSKSEACFSDCETHSIPAYLPGLCTCDKRRG